MIGYVLKLSLFAKIKEGYGLFSKFYPFVGKKKHLIYIYINNFIIKI
jgi:hypothetical protein